MPKTGTTSLQIRLARSAGALAEHGIDYPSRFRNEEGIAHHWLGNALCASASSGPDEAEQFVQYVRDSKAKHILVSSESITNAINTKHCLRMLNFLHELRQSGDINLIIVLRRIDSFFESMYLHSTKTGEVQDRVESYMAKRYRWARSFFTGLLVIQRSGLVQMRVIKLDDVPHFDEAVLRALQLRQPSIAALCPATRVNEKLSWKSQLLLLHLNELEKEIGVALPRARLIKALVSELAFQDDLTSYSILSEEQEGYLREGALAAAHSVGFRDYVQFFDNTPPSTKPRVRLDRSELTETDVEGLRAWAGTLPVLGGADIH